MDPDFELRWSKLMNNLSERFGEPPEMDAILFMIGVQELGKLHVSFNKHQKIDLLHIAICTLLEPYGYYTYEGRDGDDWPHWKATEKLPHLKPMQQNLLMRQALVNYFESTGGLDLTNP